MVIQFGKYKGKHIRAVPTDHLRCLLATTSHGPTAVAFRQELERRGVAMRYVASGKRSKKPKMARAAKRGRRCSRRGPRQTLDYELGEWQFSTGAYNALVGLERRR